MYPDSMAFRPERFMRAPDAKDGGPREPNTIAFGWVSYRNLFLFTCLSHEGLKRVAAFVQDASWPKIPFGYTLRQRYNASTFFPSLGQMEMQ